MRKRQTLSDLGSPEETLKSRTFDPNSRSDLLNVRRPSFGPWPQTERELGDLGFRTSEGNFEALICERASPGCCQTCHKDPTVGFAPLDCACEGCGFQ
jgi:hypothetical protein